MSIGGTPATRRDSRSDPRVTSWPEGGSSDRAGGVGRSARRPWNASAGSQELCLPPGACRCLLEIFGLYGESGRRSTKDQGANLNPRLRVHFSAMTSTCPRECGVRPEVDPPAVGMPAHGPSVPPSCWLSFPFPQSRGHVGPIAPAFVISKLAPYF